MQKDFLRKLMLAKRRALLPLEVKELSFLAQRNLYTTAVFTEAGTVALYASIHNEVETSELRTQALKAGKCVVYPVVAAGRLVFKYITDPSDFVPGSFGVEEPGKSCRECPIDAIDVFVVPGISFDLFGQRIGYGKGYYDRTLHSYEGTGKLIGLCYDFQIMEEILGEPHDVTMDMIVSQTRIVHPY